MWLIILSDQLPVEALVGRYPANKLIGRELLKKRIAALAAGRCHPWPHSVLIFLSEGYPQLFGRLLTRYSPVRHSPSIATEIVRLACLIHAASVRSEPESNSP